MKTRDRYHSEANVQAQQFFQDLLYARLEHGMHCQVSVSLHPL